MLLDGIAVSIGDGRDDDQMRRFDDPDCDVLVERLAKRNRLSLFATCTRPPLTTPG
jgi:hypothetical protein